MTVIYLYQGGFRAVRDRMNGIFRYAREAGWDIRPLEISQVRHNLVREVCYWGCDGLIVEGGLAGRRSVTGALRQLNLPVVWCDVDIGTLAKPPFAVQHDSRMTADIVISKLLERRGCRSFGFVTAGVRCEWAKTRENVFVERMAAARRIHQVFNLAAANRVGRAADCFRRLGEWLSALPRPCGVFAANDETGELVLTAARRFGLAVPQDVAVIGIDNDEIVCENTVPTLASIAPNFEESGHLAGDLLARQFADPHLSPMVIVYGADNFVPRASIRATDYADQTALKAVEFIRLHACESIGVEDVAAAMKCGRRSAEIRFRRMTGHSILDEIDEVRFQTARRLLERGEIPLKNLHSHCGYRSARALRDLFVRRTGLPPLSAINRAASVARKARGQNRCLHF